MTRQTGGFAWAATSTRSRSCARAMARASGSGLMPICCPSGPTRRTSRARILSLILGSPLAGGVAIAESSSCRRSYLLSAGWMGASPAPRTHEGRTSEKPTSAPGPPRTDRAGQLRLSTWRTSMRWPGGGGAPLRLRLCCVGYGHGPTHDNPTPCRMSLWTPGGEHRPEPEPTSAGQAAQSGGPPMEDLSPEDRARLEEMQQEMRSEEHTSELQSRENLV